MNIPYIQRHITGIAVNELSARLGAPVRIDHTGIDWFNRLTLEGVLLEDRAGKPLLEASHVSAGFEIWPLIRGKFVFTSARLFGFSLNLRKEHPEDPLNLQFVIDAFARKDTLKKENGVDLRFNAVSLRKGHVRYDVESERLTPGRFNARHIDIGNISANISVKAFNRDSLHADIKRLSFDEASGFTLEKLSMNFISNHDSARIDRFEVRLPRSKLKIDKAAINLSAVEGLTSLLDDAPVDISIAPSQICLQDISAFVPAFSHFTDTVELSADASGYINHIDLRQLSIHQQDRLQFDGRMELKGITRPEETYLFGKVNRMFITPGGIHSLVRNFSRQPAELPESIANAGTIFFTGEISGFFDNLVAFGRFSSSIGSLETDVILGSDKEKNIAAYVKGDVSTRGLRIDRLFGENNPYGNVRFNLSLDAVRPVNGSLSGAIQGKVEEAEYKGYKYENILLAGKFQKDGFNGMFHLDDPNGEVRMEGMFRNQGQNSVFNFTAAMRHFRPDKLNLTDRYESPDISCSLKADFTGNNIDNLEGIIRLDSLSFLTTPSGFFLEKCEIAAGGRAEERKLTITSDMINGEVAGAYSFETIASGFVHTFEKYLPSLVKLKRKKGRMKENNFSFLLTVENTEALSNTLKLPVTIVDQGRISGHYNNRYDKFRLEAWLPEFKIGKSMMESGYVLLENPRDQVDLQVKAIQYNEKGLRNYFDLKAGAGEDRIETFLTWANNRKQLFKADLSVSAFFAEDTDEKGKTSVRTEISVNESPLFINDSLWQIPPAAITIRNGKVDIDHFSIEHGEQFLHIDGLISRNVRDTLLLDLKQMELSNVFDILDLPFLRFGGEATGTFVVNDLYGSRMLRTNLEVDNFSLNRTPQGRLNLYSHWDEAQRGILLLGSIYKNDSTWTDVNGYIFPVKPNDGLSLYFDAKDLDIAFLRPFLDNVAKDIHGSAFGNVHLFGSFGDITMEGKAYVKDGGAGIDFLNTHYTFSDTVYLDTASIRFRNATVYDQSGNASKVNFTFNHAYFHDYNFQADIQANNMMVYDQPERNNPIYGTVFGSGSVSIKGNKQLIDFDINMRSEPKTSVGFNFMNNFAATEYNFITFTDKSSQKPSVTDSLPAPPVNRPLSNTGAEIRMNFQVDVTPDATIELIMDPVAGDRIKGNAAGSIQVQYGTRSDLRMYGGVNIVEGSYNFSLQQIIRKDFKIREGSAITFQGDPYRANMNVNAIYNLTANISDLDEGLLEEVDHANVPVNCVLTLEGMLQSPAISFDIELPNSDTEVERQVRSFIDTQDMMTRQIIYLLVLNRFYTPEYSTSEYRSNNNFSAVASSAISSQLSGLLNSITDKVQIGTNIRTSYDGIDNTEMEMLLSSQLLDNRLIFNGNFGYRNNHTQRNVFVGEFDLEYKLTPSGDIRLKAYNHANDMYYQYLKQSRTTQGVGLMFKKDFTRLFDIFRKKKRQQEE